MSFSEAFIAVSHALSAMLAQTVFVHSATVDSFVSTVSETAGLRPDYIRLLLSMIISFPLSILQTFIKNPNIKKMFSIIVGVSILQFCFGVGWIHSLISSVVVLLLIRFCNPKRQPIYVFVFSLLYLSLSSLYTMFTDYMSYTLDSTTYQMMLISRFQMLAWSIYDGTVDKETVDKGVERTDRWGRIYKRRQAEYVTEFPSLLDYFGFIYHFPGILGGPNTYYREYYDIMSNIRYTYGQIPSSRWKSVFVNLFKGLFFLISYVIASIYLPTDDVTTDEFGARPFIVRILVLYLTFLGVRFRYYGLWKLGESICIAAGFGEQKDRDGNTNWDGISNIDIKKFETVTNMSDATRYWNKRTQKWLQMCIYERSNFNQIYVFTVSAFWHGFYPSYYLCFAIASALQALNKFTTVKLWPRVQGTKYERFYLMCGTMCIFTVGSFMLDAMFSFSLQKALLAWKQVNYFGVLAVAIAYPVLLMIPKVKKE